MGGSTWKSYRVDAFSSTAHPRSCFNHCGMASMQLWGKSCKTTSCIHIQHIQRHFKAYFPFLLGSCKYVLVHFLPNALLNYETEFFRDRIIITTGLKKSSFYSYSLIKASKSIKCTLLEVSNVIFHTWFMHNSTWSFFNQTATTFLDDQYNKEWLMEIVFMLSIKIYTPN